jgi:hypothetical protein
MVKRYTRCHTKYAEGLECVRERPCPVHDPKGYASEALSWGDWGFLLLFLVLATIGFGYLFMKFHEWMGWING